MILKGVGFKEYEFKSINQMVHWNYMHRFPYLNFSQSTVGMLSVGVLVPQTHNRGEQPIKFHKPCITSVWLPV